MPTRHIPEDVPTKNRSGEADSRVSDGALESFQPNSAPIIIITTTDHRGRCARRVSKFRCAVSDFRRHLVRPPAPPPPGEWAKRSLDTRAARRPIGSQLRSAAPDREIESGTSLVKAIELKRREGVTATWYTRHWLPEVLQALGLRDLMLHHDTASSHTLCSLSPI
ncbi:hypothetical protein EVAR_30550_1 [Eumeta japonica]|uniref:Uncharacterized protein n=1 Tax=Eumeta variegata TaxID=151549 RepID=A0A4C1VQ03_EUMVA|nr:hypothetical protein EVAR_30550_1 [Eumeta japonica]